MQSPLAMTVLLPLHCGLIGGLCVVLIVRRVSRVSLRTVGPGFYTLYAALWLLSGAALLRLTPGSKLAALRALAATDAGMALALSLAVCVTLLLKGRWGAGGR